MPGRPHLDPYGEAVLIAKSEETIDELFERYIDASPEPIASHCGDPGCALHPRPLPDRDPFRADRGGVWPRSWPRPSTATPTATRTRSGRRIENALVFLLDAEMVSDLSGRYEPTEYGSLVSRLYVDPVTAEQIAHALLEADAFTDVGMLQVLCATPDMPALFVKSRDMDALSRFAYEREEELWMEFPWESQETFYRALKTALLLADYVSEVSEEIICERYEVAPGDIHSAVTNVAWLVHAAARLAGMFRPEFEQGTTELELCVAHGVRRELLPLIRLRGIGRVRARRLYTNGITDPEALRAAGRDEVARILGRGIADQVFCPARRIGGTGTRRNHRSAAGLAPPVRVIGMESEIRYATVTVDDPAVLLIAARRIAEETGTRIVLFDAERMAGEAHAASALAHAARSVERGDPIARTFEMEALLYAAGTRQTRIGRTFGLHEGENRCWVAVTPPDDRAWELLSELVRFEPRARQDHIHAPPPALRPLRCHAGRARDRRRRPARGGSSLSGSRCSTPTGEPAGHRLTCVRIWPISGRIRSSSASRAAPVDPGMQKTADRPTSPAEARESMDAVPISARLFALKSSPKPSMVRS